MIVNKYKYMNWYYFLNASSSALLSLFILVFLLFLKALHRLYKSRHCQVSGLALYRAWFSEEILSLRGLFTKDVISDKLLIFSLENKILAQLMSAVFVACGLFWLQAIFKCFNAVARDWLLSTVLSLLFHNGFFFNKKYIAYILIVWLKPELHQVCCELVSTTCFYRCLAKFFECCLFFWNQWNARGFWDNWYVGK